MNKKIMKSFILLFIVSYMLISCSTKENNFTQTYEENIESDQEEIIEEPEITTFKAFDTTYSSSKNLEYIKVNEDIYDDFYGNSYLYGEYKELDFAKDVLYAYVNQEEYVYDYLISHDSTNQNGYIKITEKDKEKLKKDLASLRSQMELADGEVMTLKLDKVTYQGKTKSGQGQYFKVRVAIARVGATLVPWNYFEVEVYEEGENLLAYIF
ncbi:hypothetical protein [Clostridium sp.]|uniref:hypothetical protein n=1 Tax=Clostridium sp. TaxID=1506 RepID=UPI002601B6C6|nr:hypothetical protein [Clostridium sp.]